MALRTGTYDDLNPASVDPVEVCRGLESLDNYKQWDLEHAVTAEERKWIKEIAVDEKGRLSPFFMDRICKPSIKAGTLETKGVHGASDKLRLIYSHLLAKAPADEELMHAVCIANIEGSFAPLWLITAVLRAMGRDCGTHEVREALTQHVTDGLMRRTIIDLEPETSAWSFSHDLINECILDKQSRQHPQRVGFQKIETAAIDLIEEQADENLEEFGEGLAMWVALICQRKDGALPLINKLKNASEIFTNNFDKLQLIRWLSLSARYIQRHESVLTDWSAPENYDAFILLAEMSAQHVSQDQVVEICKGQPTISPLLGLGHAIVMMGKAAKRWERISYWPEVESTIDPLIKIGKECTQISSEEAFVKITDIIPRIRYAQLLMWAGRWEDAGDAAAIAMSKASELKQERICIILQYINDAPICYMIANKRENAIEAFDTCITIARKDPNLTHLIQQLESNIEIVSKWSASNMQWSDLMGECRKMILARKDHPHSNFVFIVSGHSHATASIIGKVLKESGIESELIYAQALSDFRELPKSCGIVLVDGHLTHDVNQLMTPMITPEQYAQRAVTELLPPAYGVTNFDVEDRPGVWIASWYPWATIDAIEHWIETGSCITGLKLIRVKLLERLGYPFG